MKTPEIVRKNPIISTITSVGAVLGAVMAFVAFDVHYNQTAAVEALKGDLAQHYKDAQFSATAQDIEAIELRLQIFALREAQGKMTKEQELERDLLSHHLKSLLERQNQLLQ